MKESTKEDVIGFVEGLVLVAAVFMIICAIVA